MNDQACVAEPEVQVEVPQHPVDVCAERIDRMEWAVRCAGYLKKEVRRGEVPLMDGSIYMTMEVVRKGERWKAYAAVSFGPFGRHSQVRENIEDEEGAKVEAGMIFGRLVEAHRADFDKPAGIGSRYSLSVPSGSKGGCGGCGSKCK